MFARALLVIDVGDGGDAGGDRRGGDVERTTDAVDDVDDVGGSVHPAEPQRGEAVDLGEGAAHDDVLGRRDELDAGLVVVALDVFRIGGIEHQEDVRPAARRAGA